MSLPTEVPKSAVHWFLDVSGAEQIAALESVGIVKSQLKSEGLTSGKDFTSALLLRGREGHTVILRMDPSLRGHDKELQDILQKTASRTQQKTGEELLIVSTYKPDADQLDAPLPPFAKRVAVMNFVK